LDELSIPIACSNVKRTYGVSSISWSRDSSKMIIVCENAEQSTACILTLYGSYDCWGSSNGNELISRAEWSPKDDSILLDRGKGYQTIESDGIVTGVIESEIQIVDTKGKLIRKITNGWSPAWSPDGSEIAFFHWDEERGNPGIATIKNDGTDFHWVYRPSKGGTWNKTDNIIPGFSTNGDCMGSSKLSWSSDSKYLVTEVLHGGWCSYILLRFEVKTGEIKAITTNLSLAYQEPDIQP
jgi:Tol biopolymer transport system component